MEKTKLANLNSELTARFKDRFVIYRGDKKVKIDSAVDFSTR